MSIFDMLPPKDKSFVSGSARPEPTGQHAKEAFSFESDPIYLVYDETIEIEESKFRYRIWMGVHRTTVCLVNTISGEPPSWRSSALASFIYNKHVTKAKNGIEAPFIYIEIGKSRSNPDRVILSSVEFKRNTRFDANESDGELPVRFYGPKNRVIGESVLEILVGGPVEGV